jgi:hypothetical protein
MEDSRLLMVPTLAPARVSRGRAQAAQPAADTCSSMT